MTLDEARLTLSEHRNDGVSANVYDAILICLKALDEYAALKRNLEERRKQMIED